MDASVHSLWGDFERLRRLRHSCPHGKINHMGTYRGNLPDVFEGPRGWSPAPRPTTSDCPSIDIRELVRWGWKPGSQGLISWGPDLQIVAMMREEEMFLYYPAQGTEVAYAVRLSRTDCNYGGSRLWIHCPARSCQRRCAVLFRRGRYFLCRQCNELVYKTQYLPEWARQSRKADRLESRLDRARGDRDGKPRGMHWRTYERLMDEIFEARERYMENPTIVGLMAQSRGE